jgi:hypothetical protein
VCRRVTCKTCGKTTWAGCGLHADEVLAGVARADRCPGHAVSDTTPARVTGLLSRLGRRPR